MKKILSATILLFSLSAGSIIASANTHVSTFEAHTVTEESFIELMETDPDTIYEKYNNIIDVQTLTTDNQKSEDIRAFEYDENGILQELDCEVTLNIITYQENIGATRSAIRNNSTVYVLSATTKPSSDSTTKNGITLNGTITWIDHLGPSNEFVSVSGSRSGSYSGNGDYIVTSQTHNVGNGGGSFSGTTFSSTSGAGSRGSSFTLTVHSSTSAGTVTTLVVKTSIFD